MITRENYELYFIEFLEGTLSKEEMAMVEVFLDENPDLKAELELLEFPVEELKSEKIDFSFLKKTIVITEKNEDDFFIGYLEGDLTPAEKNAVEVYLEQHPSKKEIFNSFQQVFLEPELLSFSEKESLKKESSFMVITPENEGDFFIGYLEGDLTPTEVAAIENYIASNPANQEKLDSYKLTFLSPEIIPYPNKKELKKKKKTPIIALFAPMAAAAAVLVLVWVNFQPQPAIKSLDELQLSYKIPFHQLNNVAINPAPDDSVKQFIEPTNTELATRSPKKETKTEPIIKKREVVEANKIELNKKLGLPNLDYSTPKEMVEINIPADNNPIEMIAETKPITPLEFIKDETKDFASEKTGEEITSRNDLLAFAQKKAKENLVPNFVEVEDQKIDNQQYRTIKIGKNFSIKRKIDG